MANIFFLLLIAFGGSFAVAWILHYIPLRQSLFGFVFSPRLLMCKALAPLDATLTLILIAGTWIGITSAVTGINMMVYNVLTGIGISCGVVFIKKVMVPKWEEQYKLMISDQQIRRI